jgi:predicted PurR-regulated permease PerM
MEFFLTIAVLAGVAALLSALFAWPVWRLKKSYAKPVAVVMGVVLFVVFTSGGFILLIVESARRGHPF